MDKEREAFEAWYFDKHLRHPEMDQDGFYTYFHARDAWEGWQARSKQTITLSVKDATGEH